MCVLQARRHHHQSQFEAKTADHAFVGLINVWQADYVITLHEYANWSSPS